VKIVNISTEDFAGGAGRACYRLHKAMRGLGADSCLVALNKTVADDSVVSAATGAMSRIYSKFSHGIDKIPLRSFPRRKKCAWSPGVRGVDVSGLPQVKNADAIILYWVAGGFITPKIVRNLARLTKPIVWRLSDMWPFTGGCHYSGGCEKYTAECGECHLLGSSTVNDPSRKGIRVRKQMWGDVKITVVCPSDWMAECAAKSAVFGGQNIRVVRTGVDTAIYRPLGREAARRILGLPLDRKILLAGSVNIHGDPRKGGAEARSAIQRLVAERGAKDLLVVSFGSPSSLFDDLGVDVHNCGILSDDVSLALLYSSANVFIAPSKEENLANTVIESLSCGTPVVAFKVGGMPDMIRHRQNGILAPPHDVSGIVDGLKWCLDQAEWPEPMIDAEFSLEHQARAYLRLIEELTVE
jgi:glycosyltransferase involved in cell wall biosynthesis